ncbi:MAG: restriction endonuclease [Paludibacter sp.]|nr:restriction endonuclease [Paludibacter sp.]
MKYTTINIQGNLISEEILQKIDQAEAPGQTAAHFGLEQGANLRSEIEYAWSRIKLDWNYFAEKSQNLPANDPYGTTLTRRWMEQFLSSIGFNLSRQRSYLAGDNGQTYQISHTDENMDGFPVHIVNFLEPSHPDKNTLDIRTSGGTTRFSPHATMQEYLNVTENVYGLVTNGLSLRLIRDSGRLIKLTYLEFDLKRMLDEDKYSEFTVLYRLLHATRFPRRKQEAADSLIDKYYQDSIETGNRIRDGLSQAVKESLVALGNGLLQQPENEQLRQWIADGRLTAFDFNHQLLRLIYRLLFLMVTEERDLIFEDSTDETTKKQKDIYYRYYSLMRLRKLSENRYLFEAQYTDLWTAMMQTFRMFETGGNGKPMGIKPFGGDLFSPLAMQYISDTKLNNKVLMECIKSMNEFEDAQRNKVAINYRSLDVEELGSIYEGLLELSPVIVYDQPHYRFSYEKGSERSSSGSHYTPEDLVKPLIEHSLEYLIDDRVTPFYKGKTTAADTVKSLLDLKICDVACGSGHILLSAARRVGMEVARIESGEQQPNPTAFRSALRRVIQHCIYGVDKNPLAVELCKIALWLESHSAGEPLNFLDHHIKCGDAIVGLAHRSELENGIADEAFKTLPGDDKDVAKSLRDQNVRERKVAAAKSLDYKLEFEKTTAHSVHEAMAEYKTFNSLPETTPEEIEHKARAYDRFTNGRGYGFLKAMADTQVAQFFIPKTEANKHHLLTDAEYRMILTGHQGWQDRRIAMANAVAQEKRFFHWFLEFPEVFAESKNPELAEGSKGGGFDCILGNPPFLKGRGISSFFGNYYLNFLYSRYTGMKGQADFVGYFFRNNFYLLQSKGFISMISTNTICQGDTRLGVLDEIINQKGEINFAVKSIEWPGKAAVVVSLVSIFKGVFIRSKYLGNKRVSYISSFLDEENDIKQPFKIIKNSNVSFKGSYPIGTGFILDEEEADTLLSSNSKNSDVIFRYLNGDDINTNFDQIPSRYIINFFDWDLEYCRIQFPQILQIIEQRVKPERDKNNRKARQENWWKYGEQASGLYRSIENKKRVLATSLTTKFHCVSFVSTNFVYSQNVAVLSFNESHRFALIQSNFHAEWAWKYSATMGSSTLSYTPSTAYETFPFPQHLTATQEQKLEEIGEAYHEHRRQLMLKMQLGLTKTYNAFHAREIQENLTGFGNLLGLDKKTIEKQYGKEVWNLWNHLSKTEGTCSLEEAVAGIIELRRLHVLMDEAVLEAYSWTDVKLRHDFYEVDYLPENDRVRYTIHPEARKEILKRLLELNHKIHAEEVEAGLWEKKSKAKAKAEAKAKPYDTKVDMSVLSEPRIAFE